MHGLLKLRKMILEDPDMGWRDRYGGSGTEELAPDLVGDAAGWHAATVSGRNEGQGA